MVFVVILSCLFPLALYFLFLSSVNRRSHPVVVPGAWDFAGVLLGVSGFLIVAGPFVVVSLNDRWSDFWLYNITAPAGTLSGAGWYAQLVLWLGYFALVIGGGVLMLSKRRRVTSVYNVQPGVFRDAVCEVLDRLELEWQRDDRRFVIRSPSAVPLAAAPTTMTGAAHAAAAPQTLVGGSVPRGCQRLEMQIFTAMQHGSLYWPAGTDALRERFEIELADVLGSSTTLPNSSGRWFLIVAALLFAIAFTILIGFVLLSVVYWLRTH